jgi:hypothetical protein
MHKTLAFGALVGIMAVAHGAAGQPSTPDGRITRVAATACAALEQTDLPDVRITAATAVAAPERGITVPHCKVEGVIGREIRFEVRLPNDWNRRFVMGGGGGFVGQVENQADAMVVNRGYATAGTDTGHQGIDFEAGWALNDLERQVNYGHLAVHRTTAGAKAIVRAYYGVRPRYSYFFGCSNGGRQGLMEAQRYPDDFDGIVAGAPALDFTRIAASFLKNTQAMYPNPAALGSAAVSSDNLKLLAAKVLAACDARDSVEDAVIDDPRTCDFSVASLPACADGQPGPECVTPAQRAAIARVYGPTTVAGKVVYAGQPFGGEAERSGWGAWITGPHQSVVKLSQGRAPVLQWAFATEFFKYFVFGDPSWDYTKYDLSTWERDTRTVGSLLNADNPDLTAFVGRRGKLLLWHGWSDAALNAHSTIGYYDQVMARDPKMRDAVRLFLLPGVQHCGGGAGPDSVDWIAAIVDWVERGQAPDRLVAAKRGAGGSPVRTRPVCAYPQRVVYSGSGSTDEAERFVCSATTSRR